VAGDDGLLAHRDALMPVLRDTAPAWAARRAIHRAASTVGSPAERRGLDAPRGRLHVP
jgi:hypothetical protein